MDITTRTVITFKTPTFDNETIKGLALGKCESSLTTWLGTFKQFPAHKQLWVDLGTKAGFINFTTWFYFEGVSISGDTFIASFCEA